ncbi:MAG: molecular chaperone DnaJ [Croceicoccus sp.]|nr:molecular chaperone DnaJ [Croceicoccus sp.]MAL25307.1 molecular chaperone DnaJ [Croceicoccus sp.]
MKFLILAILALVVFRMVFHKWPWEMFRESEKSQQRAQARALLGVDRNASREDILAAHRRLILTAHPDKGGSPEEVFRIDAARDILLEQTVPTKR